MADQTTQYQDVVLNTLKAKAVIGTDADGKLVTGEGATGTFTTADSRTVTVVKGIITEIAV